MIVSSRCSQVVRSFWCIFYVNLPCRMTHQLTSGPKQLNFSSIICLYLFYQGSVLVSSNFPFYNGTRSFKAKLVAPLQSRERVFLTTFLTVILQTEFFIYFAFIISYYVFHVIFYGSPVCSKMTRQRLMRSQREEEKWIQTQKMFSIYLILPSGRINHFPSEAS